jgi:hypothetical protein
MTHYANYDDWKLSNPDDDGHYTIIEDDKPRIEESIYYKFLSKYSKKYNYGMITTSGHCITVWCYSSLKTIDVDEIDPYIEDVQDEVNRVKENYEGFERIAMQEFYAEFEQAHTNILKIVQRETRN